jgi:ArsR family transcriptional regulator
MNGLHAVDGSSLSLERTATLLHLFGDPTRVRLVALLARHELTVAELMAVTELAQSRVSTHLGKLR